MRRVYAFDNYLLYVAERRLEKDGLAIHIGSRAFDLLVALAESAGKVVGKEQLLARAWPGLTVDEGSLRYHINLLRKAIRGDEGNARYIANVPGRGYCLVVPTTVVASSSAAPRPFPERGGEVIPRRLDRMIGRDEDVSRIIGQLEAYRFVTLHGPGGIGKTTVAVAVVHQMLGGYGGAVYFLDLTVIEEAATVVGVVASALGIVLQSEDPTAEIIDSLRERRVLIVFDSCEHVVSTLAPLAEQIYLNAPGISILTTTRERLRVEGERVMMLSTLDRPPANTPITAAELDGFSATRLLAERAADHGYQTEISDADAEIVAEICRKLDGMALAIELVAGRVAIHGIRETAALLEGRFRLLWRGRRTAPPRHHTLMATIDWSHELIEPFEQVVFRRLAIFVGPFAYSAADAVVSDPSLNSDRVAEAIEGLVAKSLVTVTRDGDAAEYRLLDTTREYALAKLAEAGEMDQLARRHARHMLTLLEQSKVPQLQPETLSVQTKHMLVRESNTALRWAFTNPADKDIAVRLAAGFCDMLIEFSLLAECRRWTEIALQALGEDIHSREVEMELNSSHGHALTFTEGNSDRALSSLLRALELAQLLTDHRSQFRLLSRLHMLYRRMARFDRLEPLARTAERLAEEIGEPAGQAAAHNLLGVAFHLSGDQRAARYHLETALLMGEFHSIKPGHFAFHRNPKIALPRCMWLQGFADRAIAEATPFANAEGDTDAVTHCIGLIWSASVFEWIGDWDTVGSLAERLRSYASRHSLRPYQAVSHGMVGQCLIKAGKLDDGVVKLRSAISVLRQYRYEIYIPQLASTLAQGLSDCGRAEEARQVLDDTLEAVLTNGGGLEVPELLRVRGEVETARGDRTAAHASFLASISVADSQSAPAWRLRAETSLARMKLAEGDVEGAKARLESHFAQFTEGFATADMRAAAELLSVLSGA